MTIRSKTYKRSLALVLAAIALVGLAGWFAAGQAQAVPNTVFPDPVGATVLPAGSVDVDIIADSPDPLGLGSWDLNILYDDAVVTAISCTPHPAGGCSTIIAPGEVRILGFVGLPLTGEQTLATITFFAVGAEGQSSPVVITVTDFNDGLGDPTNPGTTLSTITIQTTSSPTASPTPGSTATPAPGSTATPAPGSTATPAPGSTATPAPGSTATPAPGSTATPAPGSTATPAPGSTATPAPGSTATPAPGSTATPAPGSTPTPTATFVPLPPPIGSLTCIADPSSAPIGSEVTIACTILDTSGDPVEGEAMTCTIVSQTGSDANVGSTSDTDSQGVAEITLFTGSTLGTIVVLCEATGIPTQVSVTVVEREPSGLPTAGGPPLDDRGDGFGWLLITLGMAGVLGAASIGTRVTVRAIRRQE